METNDWIKSPEQIEFVFRKDQIHCVRKQSQPQFVQIQCKICNVLISKKWYNWRTVKGRKNCKYIVKHHVDGPDHFCHFHGIDSC